MLEKVKLRFFILMSLYAGAFFLIFLQLFHLQIVRGSEFNKDSQKRLLRSSALVAPRGRILDRNFVPIAENRVQYSVHVARTSATAEDLNQMLYELIQIFEKNGENLPNALEPYLKIEPYAYGKALSNAPELRKRWLTDLALKKSDVDALDSPKKVYQYLKETRFRIDKKYIEEDAYKIMGIRYKMFISGYTVVNPITLLEDIRVETVAEIEEKHFLLPGVYTQAYPMRQYVNAQTSAHVVGYIGKLTPEEYEKKKEQGYGMNDFIGKVGVESYAEDYLRGYNGLQMFEVNTNGRRTFEVGGDPVIPGNDVVLTIDQELQQVAMESLERNVNQIRESADGRSNFGDAFAGAAVALDVHTGEVLVMASYPSYDPYAFVAPADDEEAQRMKLNYLTDGTAPMFNRGIRGVYRPASTFKPLVAIAGLEKGVITPEQIIYDSGRFTINGLTFTSYEIRAGYGPRGNISLKKAIGVSSNIFFYQVGVWTGIDDISQWAKYFGLGQKTGVDIPGEEAGVLADRAYKNTVLKENWYPADTAQTSIGELYNSFTPLQIANYVTTIANGGKRYKPHVIKKILSSQGDLVSEIKPEYEQIPVKPETLQAVREGMIYAANTPGGTAAYAFSGFPIKVAAKTGTSETSNSQAKISSNSVFVSFAPADDPQIAVAVVIERGVWGSNSAPVARDIYAKYFDVEEAIQPEEVLSPQELSITF